VSSLSQIKAKQLRHSLFLGPLHYKTFKSVRDFLYP
jgi:hypothetical protein